MAGALPTIVFVGTQPTLTQVSPQCPRSMTAVCNPSLLQRAAIAGPAWPAPMTMASSVSVFMPCPPRLSRSRLARSGLRGKRTGKAPDGLVHHHRLPRAQLLKISEEDLKILRPGESIEQFCWTALHQGVKLVVVTRGQSGAMDRSVASPVVYMPSVVVETVDAVGAGDTFQAALMTWLAENDCLRIDALGFLDETRLRQALAFSAQAAAITCSRRGAALPRRRELD